MGWEAWWRALGDVIRKVYTAPESLGYRPVIVGTYALMLQGRLPREYLDETKDVDMYVDGPLVMFDERVEDRVLAAGFPVGRSESGRLYIDANKPVEILYPIHGIYVPRALLEHIVTIMSVRVLEGRAVLVAKAISSGIEHLADIIRLRSVVLDINRL